MIKYYVKISNTIQVNIVMAKEYNRKNYIVRQDTTIKYIKITDTYTGSHIVRSNQIFGIVYTFEEWLSKFDETKSTPKKLNNSDDFEFSTILSVVNILLKENDIYSIFEKEKMETYVKNFIDSKYPKLN